MCCTIAGPNANSKWMSDYNYCEPCYRALAHHQFCPVCQCVWRHSASTASVAAAGSSVIPWCEPAPDTLTCSACHMWVHRSCDAALGPASASASAAQYLGAGVARAVFLGQFEAAHSAMSASANALPYFCPDCREREYRLAMGLKPRRYLFVSPILLLAPQRCAGLY
jgi:hypothetical protein